jgi:hypothetical protein
MSEENLRMSEENLRLLGAVVVSFVLLAAGLVILLNGESSDSLEKAAIGWIGLVAGYWLR